MVGDTRLQAALVDLAVDLVKLLAQVRAQLVLLVKVMLGGIHPVLVPGAGLAVGAPVPWGAMVEQLKPLVMVVLA